MPHMPSFNKVCFISEGTLPKSSP
ncbi:hypothetical protein CPC197_0583A, partial [Chlamydia psittaci C1/97]